MDAFWTVTRERPTASAFYSVRKEFSLDRVPDSFSIRSCADTRYTLLVNGHEVAYGPCQGGEEMRYYEQTDAAKWLKPGQNEIRFEILHMAERQFIAVYRQDRPGFWFEGVLTFGDRTETVVSDATWQCVRVNRRHPCTGAGLIQDSVAPFEEVGTDPDTEMPLEPLFVPHPETDMLNRYGLIEHREFGAQRLRPRPIPVFLPEEERVMPEVRRYSENGTLCLEFDASRYTTAFVGVSYCAAPGTQIRVTYAECYVFPDKKPNWKYPKKARDDASGELLGVYDTLTGTGKPEKFSTFWYRAFRYIKVECEDAQAQIEVSFRPYFYPFAALASHGEGTFSCSDPTLDQMWEVSTHTVECSTHELFVDCPYYEQQQYGQDGMLESVFAFRMTDDPRMQRKIIFDMAQSQQADGMIQANYPSVRVQIIPSFSLFWVLMNREYLRYTGDVDFVRSMTGVADRVLTGFESFLEDGIVKNCSDWRFVDWVPGWESGVPAGGRDGAVTVYSMIYAYALAAQAEVCDACGRNGLAGEYRKRREKLLKAINEKCYDAAQGLYVDVVGVEPKAYSEHTAVWAVLCGAVTGKEAGELFDRAYACPGLSRCSFSMNYFTFRALEKAGRYERYAPDLFGGWRKMLDLHCTTWCENPDDPRSECHGWSSAPIYECSAVILGVMPTADGYASLRIRPVPLGLTYASGRIPLPGGSAQVRWAQKDGKYSLEYRATKALPVEVILPDGTKMNFTEKEFSIGDPGAFSQKPC